MFRPKSVLALGLALALALTLGVGSASADIFTLTGANDAVSPYPSPYGTVDVTLGPGGTTATVTFTGGSFADPNHAGETCYYLFTSTGAVAINLNHGSLDTGSITGSNSLSGTPGAGFNSSVGPLSSGGAGQEDGFGNFNTSINSDDGFKAASTTISFTVDSTGAAWSSASDVLAANSSGYSLAAHVGVYCPADNLTGFQATGFVGNGANPVPEPSTLAIAGLGALGFIGYGLRRRRTK
jgi:hypothetical protein